MESKTKCLFFGEKNLSKIFNKRLRLPVFFKIFNIKIKESLIWKSPSLSELTPIISNEELTHLGSEALIHDITNKFQTKFKIIILILIKQLISNLGV